MTTQATIDNQKRTRSYLEEKLRELRPYHPETRADAKKMAQVQALRRILEQLNQSIREFYCGTAEDQRIADGRLF